MCHHVVCSQIVDCPLELLFKYKYLCIFVINGVEGVEEGVAPIDPYSTSILKEEGLIEDD